MVMEDYNLIDYNQHQLIRRALTLMPGPSLVFLNPTKKELRNPILKCKTRLASLMSISDCHQSTIHTYTCAYQPLIIHLLKKPHQSTCKVWCFHATFHHLVIYSVADVNVNHSQPFSIKHITRSSPIILFRVKSLFFHVNVC